MHGHLDVGPPAPQCHCGYVRAGFLPATLAGSYLVVAAVAPLALALGQAPHWSPLACQAPSRDSEPSMPVGPVASLPADKSGTPRRPTGGCAYYGAAWRCGGGSGGPRAFGAVRSPGRRRRLPLRPGCLSRQRTLQLLPGPLLPRAQRVQAERLLREQNRNFGAYQCQAYQRKPPSVHTSNDRQQTRFLKIRLHLGLNITLRYSK